MTDRFQTQSNGLIARLIASLTILRVCAVLVVVIILLAAAIGIQRYRQAQSEYQEAVRQVDEIQALAESDDVYALTTDDMAWLEDEFVTLEGRIDHLRELADLPLGMDRLVGDTPWVSQRYGAAMETLEVGAILAESGRMISNIGEEAMAALDDTGIRASSDSDRDTWLDVLQRRESELNEALDKMDEAEVLREEIDEEYLPDGIQGRLQQFDQVLERFSEQRQLADDLPLAFEALGANDPVRYLVLFQNPAETRPTGGFVGTVALVEIHRGQILEYTFHDIYELSRDYQANADDAIDSPWALAEYVRPGALQVQDANWWAHFPDTAQVLMKMVHDAGWAEVDSVVAAQPEAISELLRTTGPITVDVDGDEREVTADNLLDEAERQRRLQREGETTDTGHKEVISLIGEVLLEHLSKGNRDDMIDAAFLIFDALDRRDMQAYHSNDDVQGFLEERTWAGALQPEPGIPTLATVFANVTGLKTSLVMQPEMHLELLQPDTEGVTEAMLTISLRHFGDEQADPFYEGFQRWWLDVVLPEGANLVDTSTEPAPDPGASDGGAYIVDLDVGEQQEIAVRFTMPQTEQLLIRRQPGLRTMVGTVDQHGCAEPVSFELERDAVVALTEECPVVEQSEDDVYSGESSDTP